ncbi:hypothetical protein PanWU01x14_234250 [Parasponia andersonii]|uniref:Uncharacterized protein n=1 Tax=Parasponia andersonii TaxID=3476 RepID=A0A2P5BJC3_PARAD|nr:hypothetical protein PanWU01x14_234250 [Parasponia andersonii]
MINETFRLFPSVTAPFPALTYQKARCYWPMLGPSIGTTSCGRTRLVLYPRDLKEERVLKGTSCFHLAGEDGFVLGLFWAGSCGPGIGILNSVH